VKVIIEKRAVFLLKFLECGGVYQEESLGETDRFLGKDSLRKPYKQELDHSLDGGDDTK